MVKESINTLWFKGGNNMTSVKNDKVPLIQEEIPLFFEEIFK